MVSNQLEIDMRMQNPAEAHKMRRLGAKTGINVLILASEGKFFTIPEGQRHFQNYQGIFFYETSTRPERVSIPAGKVLVCLEGNRKAMDEFWRKYMTKARQRIDPSSRSNLLSRLASYK